MTPGIWIAIIICGTLLVLSVLAAVVALKAIDKWGGLIKTVTDVVKKEE